MGGKISVWLLGTLLLAVGAPAEAQRPQKLPHVGFLSAAPSIDPAFLEGLRQHGYIDKQTILIEHRTAEGKLEKLAELAADLVRLKLDTIVTQGTPAAQAAKTATATVPIVMATTGDAVGTGLVESLAHPGGNITGLSFLAPDIGAKRLELFKEAVPSISRVAVLVNPAIVTEVNGFDILQVDARNLGVSIRKFELRNVQLIDDALAMVIRDRFQGAILPPNSSYLQQRQLIVSVAAKRHIPMAYGWREFPEAGGLMSYGVSVSALFHRAAVYVDKILKGAKPADLPVEQPKKFEFVINLIAAKQIGLTIPPNVLARADKVIR